MSGSADDQNGLRFQSPEFAPKSPAGGVVEEIVGYFVDRGELNGERLSDQNPDDERWLLEEHLLIRAYKALSVSPPVVEGSLQAQAPSVPTEGQEAAVVGLETVETSWAYEYRNRHSDGEWKRSSFHKYTGGIPTTRAEAAAMVEKKAQHWVGGTELRLVERVTTTSPADVFVSPLPVTERDAWGIYQAAPDTALADKQPGIFALRENEPKDRHQPTTPGEQGEEGA